MSPASVRIHCSVTTSLLVLCSQHPAIHFKAEACALNGVDEHTPRMAPKTSKTEMRLTTPPTLGTGALQLDVAQQHVMRPLVCKAVLPQHRRDLTPVPDSVKKDIRRDLVFAG
jgi:hypothetical protein